MTALDHTYIGRGAARMDTDQIEANLPAVEALRGRPDFPADCIDSLSSAVRVIVASLASGGTLYVTGNGGSMADALHIAGELTKSFEKTRPLPISLKDRLTELDGGHVLAENLQAGLRVQVVGADPVLATAVDNDIQERHLGFAQHLVAMGRPGDVLLTISTSGRSRYVTNAALVARALDMSIVVLTGGGEMTDLTRLGNVVVRTTARATAEVQSQHVVLYHALCRAVEDSFF